MEKLWRAGEVFVGVLIFGGLLTAVTSLIAMVAFDTAEVFILIGLGATVSGMGIIGFVTLAGGVLWIFEDTKSVIRRTRNSTKGLPRSGTKLGLYD